MKREKNGGDVEEDRLEVECVESGVFVKKNLDRDAGCISRTNLDIASIKYLSEVMRK